MSLSRGVERESPDTFCCLRHTAEAKKLPTQLGARSPTLTPAYHGQPGPCFQSVCKVLIHSA